MNEEIREKTEYCLNCKVKPCSNKGCPLNNNIPEFIKQIKEEKYEDAYYTLCETTVLESICGKICPHEKQCQGSCIRGIKGEPVSIGRLEAYIGEMAIKNGYKIPKNQDEKLEKLKVAVIGAGPAGLTCSAFLAKKGVNVTIYEKYDYLGGLLVHGIPEFRLKKEDVRQAIDKILELGIDVKYNQELGKNLSLEELEKSYDAIFLAIGANVSTKLGVDGENLDGVYGGNELLEYKNHPNYEGKVVIVNGGGNVAMDVARTINKMGAKKVYVTYRRSRAQMPAENKEVEDAINEGVEFLFQNSITKIIGNNSVEKVELIKTELIQKPGETRLSPVNIENSNYEIKADIVVMAIGSKPEEFVRNLGLELDKWGKIKVDENGKTSNPKIYAGGDLAGYNGTVAWAAKFGRIVADAIIQQTM